MKRKNVVSAAKWVLIAALSPLVALFAIFFYDDYKSRHNKTSFKTEAEQLSLNFDRQASPENIDSCLRALISKRFELSDYHDIAEIDSLFRKPLKNNIYLDMYKVIDNIDFNLIDSMISISTDDTIYVSSTSFADYDETYVDIACYSSAKTFEYVNKSDNRADSFTIRNKIPGEVYNIKQTVSKDFTDTSWSLTLGAKIIIRNDTIRYGTIYFHTFPID